jgi:hypothetical protein
MNVKSAALLFFSFFCAAAFLQAAEISDIHSVMDVSDRYYYKKLRELFLTAKNTIDISAEAVTSGDSPDDPVSILIQDLITAQKRGVRVRFFLNTFTPSGTKESLFLHDDILWNMRNHGIEIHFVNPSYYLRDQLIIIDHKEVLEGGLRWTRDELENRLGSATLMSSEQLAEQKRLRLEFLPLWDVEQKKSEEAAGTVAVPFYLIHELPYFPQMVINDDGDAIKIYLTLLRIFYQVQDVHLSVNYEELGSEIPADQYFEPHAVLFQTVKTLERLEEAYGLIQIEKKESDRARIRMVFPSQKDALIKVPVTFFQEGYSKNLTPPAIFAYLVLCYKTQISGEAPVWLGSERNIEQDFPLSKEKFRNGIMELRQQNLVEVFPFELQEGYRKLESLEYRYLLNAPKTMSERLELLGRLRDQFGSSEVEQAQALAALLGEPEDPKVIASYLDLLKHFKEEDVRVFTERLSTLPPESTPELMDYLRTLLEYETQKKTQLVTI